MAKKASVQYEVSAEAPSAVRQDLVRIWGNLDLHGDREAKYVWSYEHAPQIPDTVYVLRAEGQVVGSAGYGIRMFRLAGRDVQAAVLGDLAVMPEHRSLLPALALVKAGRDFVERTFGFSYGMPNSKAEPVITRAKYKQLGRVVRYAKIARHSAYLKRVANNIGQANSPFRMPRLLAKPLLAGIIAIRGGRLLDHLYGLGNLRKYLRARRKYELEWTNLTDARLGAIWRTARDEYEIVGMRTSSFLSWRFANTDAASVAILAERSTKVPVAYAVVAKDHMGAAILDVFGHVAVFLPLLTLLFHDLSQDPDVRVVSCSYLGRSDFVRALLDCGFRLRGDVSRCVCTLGGQLPPDLLPILNKAESWHLTSFDEDI